MFPFPIFTGIENHSEKQRWSIVLKDEKLLRRPRQASSPHFPARSTIPNVRTLFHQHNTIYPGIPFDCPPHPSPPLIRGETITQSHDSDNLRTTIENRWVIVVLVFLDPESHRVLLGQIKLYEVDRTPSKDYIKHHVRHKSVTRDHWRGGALLAGAMHGYPTDWSGPLYSQFPASTSYLTYYRVLGT